MLRHTRLYRARRTLCAGLLALAMPMCWAWPDKPVKIVAPAPPGGLIDIMARLLAEQLTADGGQAVIVENKPGGSGSIGIQALLAAPADGQTIMVTASNVLTEAPHVLKTPFDPLKDVKPAAAVALTRLMLVGSSGLPPKDAKTLIGYVKANPGKLSFGTYGVGTASHYAGVILNQKAGLDLQHVPFPGAPAVITQVIGGQVTIMFDNIAHSMPMVRAGKLQVYGLASKTRSPLLPDVPTFAELGYPDLEFTNSMVVLVSAGVSPQLIEQIRAATLKAAATAKVQQHMVEMGFEPIAAQSTQQLAAALRSEYERNAGIVKTFHIRVQD